MSVEYDPETLSFQYIPITRSADNRLPKKVKKCKEIKKHLPNAIIILGGAFVNDQFLQKKSDLFLKYLKKYQVNYIIYSFIH